MDDHGHSWDEPPSLSRGGGGDGEARSYEVQQPRQRHERHRDHRGHDDKRRPSRRRPRPQRTGGNKPSPSYDGEVVGASASSVVSAQSSATSTTVHSRRSARGGGGGGLATSPTMTHSPYHQTREQHRRQMLNAEASAMAAMAMDDGNSITSNSVAYFFPSGAANGSVGGGGGGGGGDDDTTVTGMMMQVDQGGHPQQQPQQVLPSHVQQNQQQHHHSYNHASSMMQQYIPAEDDELTIGTFASTVATQTLTPANYRNAALAQAQGGAAVGNNVPYRQQHNPHESLLSTFSVHSGDSGGASAAGSEVRDGGGVGAGRGGRRRRHRSGSPAGAGGGMTFAGEYGDGAGFDHHKSMRDVGHNHHRNRPRANTGGSSHPWVDGASDVNVGGWGEGDGDGEGGGDGDGDGGGDVVDGGGGEEKRKGGGDGGTKAGTGGGKKRAAASSSSAHGGENMSKPGAVQAAAAMSFAAVAGGLVLGPIGVIVGATAVGLAAGYNSLSDEEWTKLQSQAKSGVSRGIEAGHSASEKLSSTCVTAVRRRECPYGVMSAGSKDDLMDDDGGILDDASFLHGGHSVDSRVAADRRAGGGGAGEDDEGAADRYGREHRDGRAAAPRMLSRRENGGKARMVPINKIHSLDPSLQPRAWLDVMSSEFTTEEEKSEAMEEILIFAKDKNHGRMFLEEGILDPLLLTLRAFFQKYYELLHHLQQGGLVSTDEKMDDGAPTPAEALLRREALALHHHACRAAHCCVALGKAHCAVVHTEGDLLLMSAYKRGTVPEGRQLAQMLYEVPHHTTVTEANNVDDNGDEEKSTKDGVRREHHVLTEMSMQQAEELAKLMKELTEGKMHPQSLS